MTRKPGMLISDEEIRERFGDVLPKLDEDPHTQIRATRNGKRYRPAVEKALTQSGGGNG